jgi:uncharacterized membrane protein HdeD (DUF308 family)
MPTRLLRYWWIPLVRGLFAIAFGVCVFVEPASALAVIVLLFGAFAFANGVMAIIAALHRDVANRGLLIFEGIAGALVGVLTFISPPTTALVLYSFIAAWAIVTGISQIIVAIRWRKVVQNEVWMILAGISSVVFGVLLLALPMAGFIALAAIIGSFSLFWGVILIALGLRLRGLEKHLTSAGAAAGAA